jgi:hypothetical protein
MIEQNFLACSVQRLAKLCERVEICLGKLTADQVWMRGSENDNAIGNLVLHLNGNVRQWIVSGVGGAEDIRVRQAEFDARGGAQPQELARLIHGTVEEAVAIIQALPPSRLAEQREIQGYQVTVLEAIYQVVEHFSGHTMQIIFITKMATGEQLGFYSYLNKPEANAAKVPRVGLD